MGVLNMNPHTLFYEVRTESYRDENGDFHKGESTWKGNIKCSAVPAGKENQITLPDGTVGQYEYIIYTSKNCRKFSYGEKIRLTLLEGETKEFSVKGFHRYQLQCKIFV